VDNFQRVFAGYVADTIEMAAADERQAPVRSDVSIV
jgi:hypothetical protein